MIGHPRRILRTLLIRIREYWRLFWCSLLPETYSPSYQWGFLYADSGKNNKICVSSWCDANLMILVSGSNNKVSIGRNVRFGPKCAILIDGDNCEVEINDNCSFTRKLHLAVTESQSRCIIGADCMFSYNIVVRTSDAHPVYDIDTQQRINLPADTIIGEHVWVGPNCTISKGVHVGNNSVIAQHSLVNKDVPNNVVAAGIPAIVKKNNTYWTKIIQENPFEKCETRYVPDLRHRIYDEWLV